jgi:hypothetical protein
MAYPEDCHPAGRQFYSIDSLPNVPSGEIALDSPKQAVCLTAGDIAENEGLGSPRDPDMTSPPSSKVATLCSTASAENDNTGPTGAAPRRVLGSNMMPCIPTLPMVDKDIDRATRHKNTSKVRKARSRKFPVLPPSSLKRLAAASSKPKTKKINKEVRLSRKATKMESMKEYFEWLKCTADTSVNPRDFADHGQNLESLLGWRRAATTEDLMEQIALGEGYGEQGQDDEPGAVLDCGMDVQEVGKTIKSLDDVKVR